ncbi:MAG: hypothetical protein JNM43_11235 [Planctomycetaceae bacterium]|nr:hypothetical protein [Planctomycetaceae bacterium]
MKSFYCRQASYLLLIPAAVVLAGCQALHCQKEKTAEAAAAPKAVVVGGLVSNPGEYVLRENVETLADVLSLAGISDSTVARTLPQPRNSRIIELGEQLITDTTNLLDAAKRIQSSVPEGTKLTDAGLKEALTTEETALYEIKENFNRASAEMMKLLPTDLVGIYRDKVANIHGQPTADRPETRALYTLINVGVSEQALKELKVAVLEFQTMLNRVLASSRGEFTLMASSSVASGANYIALLKREGKSYHFPVSYVKTGFAGEIALKHADRVSVERVGDTVLSAESAAGGNALLLSGWVRSPGLHPPGEPLLQIVNTNLRGTRLQTDKLCVIVERSEQIFVLPYDSISNEDSAFGSISTLASDRVHVAPYFQAPLIAETVVGKAAEDALALRTARIVANRPILTHEEEKHVRMQKAFRSASAKVGRFMRP